MIWAALIPAWLKQAVAWLLAGLVAFAGVWGLAKRSERRAAKLDTAKETIKAHEDRDEVEADVAADLDPRKRLRDDWSR